MIILGVCGYGDRDIASSPLNRLQACRKQIRQVAISEIASADFVSLGMTKKGVIVSPLPGLLQYSTSRAWPAMQNQLEKVISLDGTR
jgi:hypothetical protein